LARRLPNIRHATRGFTFDQDATRRFWRAARANRPGEVDEFRATFARPGGRPGLHVLHSMLPHAPWEYTPSGRSYWWLGDRGHVGTRWRADEWTVVQAQQRHLPQRAFVDRLLGEILTQLREVDLYDRCVLIVTADHGMSFRAGE